MKAGWIPILIVAATGATGVAMAADTSATGTTGADPADAGPSTMHTTNTTMEALDLDQDHVISLDEANVNSELARQFSELDRNDDGRLDQGEFARFEPEAAQGQGDETGTTGSGSGSGGY